jgi:hypothetical protein
VAARLTGSCDEANLPASTERDDHPNTEGAMAETKTVTIMQTVHVPHNRTIVESWYDVVERTIMREIAADGTFVEESVDREEVVAANEDHQEEVMAEDEGVDAEEVVSEEFID